MNAGGSGELCTTHVRFIVEPLSMYKSGAPIISVDGSAGKKRRDVVKRMTGKKHEIESVKYTENQS